MYTNMILTPSPQPPPPGGPVKYRISGDDVLEIPVSFHYCRKDSIQDQTLWFSEQRRCMTGSIVFAYHISERYIKKTESAGSLPDSSFNEMLLSVVIS